MPRCLENGCKRHACHGSLRCASHDPAKAEARRQLAAKMVQARAAKRQQRLNAAQQPTTNLSDNPSLRTSCKKHAWSGGWWEDCPFCLGRTASQNPDEVPTQQWVEKTKDDR